MLPSGNLQNEVVLENVGKFTISLTSESTESLSFEKEPFLYGRMVSKIVDIALCNLSKDYYKYSEMSPYIMERGEGYFDKSLRERIGIEDGRRFYRGVQIAFGKPYLILNREIELRSWKNLLNELKTLAQWWQQSKRKTEAINFYDPPKEFVTFINWAFRNRTANVIRYPSASIIIKEITWDFRANDNVLDTGISPSEYHRTAQGIRLEDENQPLIKWQMVDRMGASKEQYHVPELLVVGHNFKDIRMRISPSQVSQVFDILHPHCGDQQRKIYDAVRKIDYILRNNFKSLYGSKLEFNLFPANVNDGVTPPSDISLKFGNKNIEVSPPYGISFYRKYGAKEKFSKPLTGTVRIMAFCSEEQHPFVNSLVNEVALRNDCQVDLTLKELNSLESHGSFDCDMVLTVTNDDRQIKFSKETILNKFGIAHQNVTPEKASENSIPQLVMQMTLKLGGYPWQVLEAQGLKALTIYAYRNPFNGSRYTVFNIFDADGTLLYQSKPYDFDSAQTLFDDVKSKVTSSDKLLVIMSFWDPRIEDRLIDCIKESSEYVFVKVLQNDELRLFSTYRPVLSSAPRRRTTAVTSYPCESYENAPQGAILNIGNGEYYISTTGSTKVGTYHRGCPTPILVKVLSHKGNLSVEKVLHSLLSMSMGAGVSGHGTRLPSSLYYLKMYARYINEHGLPSEPKVMHRIFYV